VSVSVQPVQAESVDIFGPVADDTLAVTFDLERGEIVVIVAVASGTTVTPGTGSLVLTGYAPTVVINTPLTPSTASLTLTGYAPSVVANTIVTPSTGSLTLTGYAPTVVVNTIITPSTGTLTLTGYAPVLDLGITPSTASLTLTGYAPTVAATANVSLTPDTASLVLTGYAPTVTATANISVTPDTASLTLTGYAPDVVAAGSVTLTPDTASLVLTGYAPDVTATETAATQPIRRVIITPPRVRRIPASVDSEIEIVSTVTPHVEQRFVLIPSVVAGELPITVEGTARPSVLRRGTVGSAVELGASGMMRASIDNDAEVLALVLGVSLEMAVELV